MRAPKSFGSGGFSSSSFKEQEDVDPRVGLVNLADVMLVFACGLMLALVVHWNVNVSNVTEMDQQDMTEIDQSNVENMVDNMSGSGSNYNELGRVYQDPTTGKMYLLQEESGSGKADSGTSGSSSKSGSTSSDSGGDSNAGSGN